MTALKLIRRLKLLACAFALAAASCVYASPVQVHFAVYNASGHVLSDANGPASGIIGVGSSWLNNPALVGSEHLTNYLINFWIDPVENLESVNWTFDSLLGNGATVKAVGTEAEVDSVKVTTTLTIGTDEAAWNGVSNLIAPKSSLVASFSGMQMVAAGTTASFGSPATHQSSSEIQWNGGSTLSVWAYLGARASYSGDNNTKFTSYSYGIVTAFADVSIAKPERIFVDIFGSETPGGLSGGAVPEPCTALLAGLGALLAAARSRKRRLKLPR